TQPRGKQVLRPSRIYYTPTTGIWQTVWLEPVPTASVKALRIVPDVDGGKVRVTVQAEGATAGAEARVVVLDGASPGGEGKAPAGQDIGLPVAKAKLWSPDSPFLYNLRVELRRGDQRLDTVTSYFGMRSVCVGPDEKGIARLLLNGKPVFQVGPLDQGFW